MANSYKDFFVPLSSDTKSYTFIPFSIPRPVSTTKTASAPIMISILVQAEQNYWELHVFYL